MDVIYLFLLLLLLNMLFRQTQTVIKNIIVSLEYHKRVIILSVSYKKYHKTLGKRAKRHPFLY